MNDPVSWDQSIVKKFSSSNHYKLLNQLRNEVKKYPLNNKKKIALLKSNETTLDNTSKSNESHLENKSSSSKENQSNDTNSHNVSVSFNNAKNFSIYNKTNNNSYHNKETMISDQLESTEDFPTKSFKDRLNQIDMK